MPQYSKYTRKDTFESTDLLSGVNERGEFRLFENDGVVDFITQLILQYTSDTSLTKDEADAIKNALNPSLNNVFITESALAITIREESTAFSLSSTDSNTYIRYTGATDISVTVPNTLLEGQPVTLWQAGAGVITLVGDTDVVLNGDVNTAGQNKAIQVVKVADNLFDVIGGVA